MVYFGVYVTVFQGYLVVAVIVVLAAVAASVVAGI